jgi:hypothetical protein
LKYQISIYDLYIQDLLLHHHSDWVSERLLVLVSDSEPVLVVVVSDSYHHLLLLEWVSESGLVSDRVRISGSDKASVLESDWTLAFV